MGWGYRKSKTFGLPGLRWLFHVRVNATQKGLTSWGWKLICLGWNSRTGWHFDGPGGVYWRQRKGRESRRGAAGGAKPSEPRRRRGPVSATGAWAGRWVARGATWAGTQTAARTRSGIEQMTAPYRQRADQIRQFGFRPAVVDSFTGAAMPASDVHMPEWALDDGDPAVREEHRLALKEQQQRDQEKWLQHAMRPRPLSPWEQWAMRRRGEDPTAWTQRSEQIRVAVLRRRGERLGHIDPNPVPASPVAVICGPSGPHGGRTPVMANAVTSFADLHDPDIDPFEYPDQLPEFLGNTQRLVANRAEEYEAEADSLAAEAEALEALVEYMQSAEADQDMCSSLQEAADSARAAAGEMRRRAQLFGEAADSVGAARTRAEAAYGDQQVPRFDRAG